MSERNADGSALILDGYFAARRDAMRIRTLSAKNSGSVKSVGKLLEARSAQGPLCLS